MIKVEQQKALKKMTNIESRFENDTTQDRVGIHRKRERT